MGKGMSSMLHIENLRKVYRGGKVTVDNLTLDIKKGRLSHLLGRAVVVKRQLFVC